MSRLTDEQVRAKGTPVVVKNVEDLTIYHGKIKPVFSAPCENWFEDNDPPAAVPTGHIAVRQLSSGCLAFLAQDKREAWECSEKIHEELDRSEKVHEELGLSEKKRRWDRMDVLDSIFSLLFPKWW